MPRYNILIGCDQLYFDIWGLPLLRRIQYHSPWINLHCHIVNPIHDNQYDNINITTERKSFVSLDSKLSYLQAVRFLIVANKFENNDYIVTLDADSICTSHFTQSDFSHLFDKQYILYHQKAHRWLAGFVTFCNNNFAQEFAYALNCKPVDLWTYGRDQYVLSKLANKYKFKILPEKWMSIGKNKINSYFLTLKGNQKYKEKYLTKFKNYKDSIK